MSHPVKDLVDAIDADSQFHGAHDVPGIAVRQSWYEKVRALAAVVRSQVLRMETT